MPVFKLNDVFAGRYVLKELIGEGGFSEVWKAHDQMADDAVVALKIYAPEKGLDDFGVRQFRKEFSLTHHLSHPHLMKVYHFDISDGSPYLIMPFCPFGSLTRFMGEAEAFTERQVALVMCQIGAALKELHSQDPPILHQDIKPDNILVLNTEYFLLADFGISSQIRHTLRKSTSNMRSLTVAYAPPERFDRHPVSDIASDVFSLGVTLYEMCTNNIPWDGSGGQSLLKGAHIPSLPETYSNELNQLLQRCMEVDRSKRPAAEEIYLRGRSYLETGQWHLPKKRKNGTGRSGKKLPTYLVAATVLLALLSGLWFYNGMSLNNAGLLAVFSGNTLANDQGTIKELEQEINELKGQLLSVNRQLLLKDSVNKALLLSREEQENRYKGALAEKDALLASYKKKQQSAAGEKTNLHMTKGLEEYLNRISDPGYSRKDRQVWKQEIITHFAGGSVPVLAELNGNQEKYQASFFLNLLTNVHYQLLIAEVKRNPQNKVIELHVSLKSE